MHFQQLAFVSILRSQFPVFFQSARVLEIGAYDVNGSIRELFDLCDYIGVDLVAGPGVTDVVSGHLYDSGRAFDAAFSCECFEHNPEYLKTFANMVRLTRPGGLVAFTCATTGRPEHGTHSSLPDSAPGTMSMGWDYYRNLTESDFGDFDFASHFAIKRFFINPGSQDLYFVGIKQPAPDDVTVLFTRIEQHVGELVEASLDFQRADVRMKDGDDNGALQFVAEDRLSLKSQLLSYARHKQIWLLMRLGRLPEAKASSDELLRLCERGEYWWQRSSILHRMQMVEEALSAARKAVALAPNNAQFLQNLGTLLVNAGRLEEAEPVLLEAARLAPNDSVCQHRLSMLRLRQKRHVEALAAAELAVRFAPENDAFVRHRDAIRAVIVNGGASPASDRRSNIPSSP